MQRQKTRWAGFMRDAGRLRRDHDVASGLSYHVRAKCLSSKLLKPGRRMKLSSRSYTSNPADLSPTEMENRWRTFLHERYLMEVSGIQLPRGIFLLLCGTLVTSVSLLATDEGLKQSYVMHVRSPNRRRGDQEEVERQRKEDDNWITEKESEGYDMIFANDDAWIKLCTHLATPLSEDQLRNYKEERRKQAREAKRARMLEGDTRGDEADEEDEEDWDDEEEVSRWQALKDWIFKPETKEDFQKKEEKSQRKQAKAKRGGIYYAPELLNTRGMALMDIRVKSIEQYMPVWETVGLAGVVAAINGWIWGKIRCASIWRNQFRPQDPIISGMRHNRLSLYKMGYSTAIMNSSSRVAAYSVLASLFMTVPAVLLWEGLKRFSGAFNHSNNNEDNNNKDKEDDVTMREIYPSGAHSILLLTALPIIGFTGLLWTLLHHPLILLPSVTAVALVLPARLWHRRTEMSREGWDPELLTDKTMFERDDENK